MGKVTKHCDLCAISFQYGPQKYDGQYLPHYGIYLCEGCYRGNPDGFAPHLEDKISALLEANRVPLPQRNDKGWYPR